jgi:trans-AT polyketide synthase, acyltransferase and oxidoreductase domains
MYRLFSPENLGSAEFKKDFSVQYAYVSGAMYRGIASKELVVRMGKAGFLGIYGSGGIGLKEVEKNLDYIQSQLNAGQAYGMNLISTPRKQELERALIELYLRKGVRIIEAAAFMQITPALVLFRIKGISKDRFGRFFSKNKIMAKVSRPEIAKAFLSPPPQKIVDSLLRTGDICEADAKVSQFIPMSDALCAEADSGGHTDMGVLTALLPTIINLRNEVCKNHQYINAVRVGAAGGIGTPEAIASVYLMGADFVLTGSINQCTVEAATSDTVKDMLQQISIQDTDYAPAGDMFELGSRVQVMKRGVFFPTRANKLYDLWRMHDSLDDIDRNTRKNLEEKYFRRSFSEVYDEIREHYLKTAPQVIEEADNKPKQKMALIFRWYFFRSAQLAMSGNDQDKVNFQVHTGPALGAFNQWIKGTAIENWRRRHVDQIANQLMAGAADTLNNMYQRADTDVDKSYVYPLESNH